MFDRKAYHKEYEKQWRENHPDHCKEYRKKYYQEHKEECNSYERNKRKTDTRDNLNNRMSNAIYKSLKGNKNGRRWESLVGYTCNNLIKHLEKTMPEGYTEDDIFNGKLHIDHIIPKCVFNYNNPEHPDFKRCWALKNLRLLPAKENMEKSNKIYKPLQLSLAV